MAGILAEIKVAINELETHFNVPLHADGDTTPVWLRDDYNEDEILGALNNA